MERPAPRSGDGGRIVGAAVLIAAFTALSRLLGFVREAVFAAVFGASGDLDAYYVALGGPNLIIALVSTAAVTTSVPVLSRLVAEGDPERAGRTWGSVFVVVTATVALGAAVLAVFAEQVVRVTAPGFPPERADLAAELMRIVLVGAVLVAVMNLVTGLLQSHRHFFWPAIVGVPFNLVLIAAALLFGGDSGVYAIAVGFVVGSFARVVVQLPGLRRVHAQPRLGLQLRDPYVRTALTLAPLVLIGHAISSVNTLVDRLVASTQVEGTISALNYGYRLVLLPYGLVAVALLQAMYPALGGSRRLGAPTSELHMLVRSGFGALGLLLVPAAVALLVLRDPLVELAYERGAFDSRSASLTAAAVGGYALGLLFLAWRELIARAFYAAQDARTPVMAALAGMVVNVVGDVTLGVRYGVGGLAASTTLAFGVSFLLLLVRFERKLGRGFLRKAGASTLRLGAAGALAAVTMAAVRIAFPEGGGESALIGLLAASIGAGLAVYVVALGLVGSKELRDFRTAVGRLWRGWRRPRGPRH